MSRTLRCLICIALVSFSLVGLSQQNLPNTLLWRITGRGLSKPSYLFGTMHVKDRRVFQFSDSLYHFLETTDGYAMEIDPDAAMAALFKTLTDPDTTGLLQAEMRKDDFKRLAGDLEKRFGVPASRITKKQAWLYKMSSESSLKTKPDDMDAAIDLYLYNIAKQSGKWVGGIEDIEDQFNIINELGAGFDASELLPGKRTTAMDLEKLLQIYKAQDLNKIEAFISAMPAGQRDTLLLRRNHKMARRMDSLMQARSLFLTVGAAHLPGTEGVLKLLSDRGFMVEPVFSKKTVAPEKYAYAKKEQPWHTVTNDEKSYAVSMPGEATVLSPDGFTKMRVYADLGTGLIYFSGSFPAAASGNRDSMLLAAASRFMSGSRTHTKPQFITYNGQKALEALKDSNTYLYRMRLYPNGNQLVLLMLGSEKRNHLYGDEAQRFYNSLILTPVKKGTKTDRAWYAYTNETLGIKLAFPDTPQVNKVLQHNLQQREAAGSWRFINQTALDAASNKYYMLIAKETKPGYHILSDYNLFEEARKNVESANEIEVTRYDTGRWQGLPAMWMEGKYKQNKLLLKSLTVNRSNRGYSLMAIYDAADDTADVSRFFSSLQLPPVRQAAWKTYTDPARLFTTTAPAPLQRDGDTDSSKTTTSKPTMLVSFDSLSALSFQVNIEPVATYYWTTSDSAYFASTSAGYIATGDSLLYAHKVSNGDARGMEYLVQMEGGRNVKKLRFLLSGDSAYLLYCIAPEADVAQASVAAFFNDFRFVKYRAPQPIFQNRSKALLTALQIADSATFEAAKTFIATAPFATTDLPLLHQALLYPYRDLDNDSYGTHHQLFQRAIALSDTATVAFIKQAFASLKDSNAVLQYPFLKALAGVHTTLSYGVLKNLLLQQ